MITIWAYIFAMYVGFVYGKLYQPPTYHPSVNTSVGVIRGMVAEDGDYNMYLGIPYAKVNEDNPFGVALPYPIFDEPYEAYNDTKICPQYSESEKEYTGTLDCLRLNIYVPNGNSTTDKKAVMVWIHGGKFNAGSSRKVVAGPKYLIRHDVIMVSINYRLGVYGFMCLDTPEIPGNQGLKDQYLAIKWVKDNIEVFGGDVTNITIMGGSAGAMSVDHHLLTKRVKHFTRAIMQSGSAMSPREIVKPDPNVPILIAKQLRFDTNNLTEAVKFLSKIYVEIVIEATKELGLYFRPCVEKYFDNVENFVSEHPQNATSNVGDMPILAGFNSDEQLRLYSNKPSKFFTNLTKFLYGENDEFQDVDNMARHFYIGDDDINEHLKWELIKFASDYKFNYPIQKSLIRYLKNGGRNIYQYMFSYGGRNDFDQLVYVSEGGASHGDELGYLFYRAGSEPTPEDKFMIDRMTIMWANFAKYGNPTPETSSLLPVKWTPITEDVISYMNIGTHLTMGTRPYHEKMTFWELFHRLYPEEFLYQ